jgi:uncharacterized protein YbdZ (MbtH family)
MSEEKNKDPFDFYYVVKNDNNDHSIWPCEKSIPSGWDSVEPIKRSKAECLAWIEVNWDGPRLQ